MDVQTSIQTRIQITHERTTTEVITVAPGVEVQRITVARQTGDQPETSEVTEKVEHQIETQDPHFGQFVVLEPELLERLRLKGWFVDDKDWGLVSRTPFTRVQDGRPYQVVRLRHYDHSLFDLQGQRLPVAQNYNYIDGRVNDYSFDLKRLLQHLQGREDVTIRLDRFSDNPIHRIPSYNAGDITGYHGLSFTWHPDAALFRRYCEMSAKRDHFERHAAAHQLMGNDQFRIEHSEDERDED